MYMDIQMIINEMNAQLARAQKERQELRHLKNMRYAYVDGIVDALAPHIDQLNLFLKSAHESNHKDFAHCTNTRLGECAAPLVESSTIKEVGGERLSETGIVRQNEQAKEVPLIQCPYCLQEFNQKIDAEGHRCRLNGTD